jgi:hypothetical protein
MLVGVNPVRLKQLACSNDNGRAARYRGDEIIFAQDDLFRKAIRNWLDISI